MTPSRHRPNSFTTKGLQFLAKTQNEKGAWNDSVGAEAGVVGLCVASFLAHGEDPVNGPYAKNIRTGIDYILSQQNEKNGYIGSSMYNHAFATKALAESYGVVDNPKIAPALKKAVEMILSSQKRNHFGAWRYTPDSRDADTTCTGCQMVTLFAARNAGIAVPDEAIRKGLAYLNNNRSSDGSYGYTSASGGKPTLTAIGILCLSLAKETDSKGYQTSLEYPEEEPRLPRPLLSVLFRVLHVPGVVPCRRCSLEGVERPQHPLSRHHSGIRRLVPRKPRPVLQHRRRAALAGAQLPLSTHLRKMIRSALIPCLCALAGSAAAEAPADLLRFTNGDQLHGSFLGIKDGLRAIWQRDDVAAPVDFKTTRIRHIVLHGGRPLKPLGSLSHVGLVNGDRMPGTITAIDDDSVTLDTSYAGILHIPRKQVAMLAPNPLGGRVYYPRAIQRG